MLIIGWEWRVLYWDEPQWVNQDKYCSIVDWLNEVFDEKRPEFTNGKNGVFHQEKIKHYIYLPIRQKFLQIGYDVFLLPRHLDLVTSV